METPEITDQIKRLQRHFFGERFVGACCSNIRVTREHTGKILAWLKNQSGMLILAGNPGVGKSYLCSAFVAWMHGKVRDIYGLDEAEFFKRIRGSIDLQGDYNTQISYQLDHDFFIFDDLGSTGQGQTGWRQEVLFTLINDRYESKLPTVITTNLTRKGINEKIGARAYSRLYAEENTIIEMFNYPDLRNPLNFREDAPQPKL